MQRVEVCLNFSTIKLIVYREGDIVKQPMKKGSFVPKNVPGVGWGGVGWGRVGWVGHEGVGWGGVGWGGWVMKGWGGVGLGGVCHVGVGWGVSCRGGVGGSCREIHI